ncbi:NADH-quinone oxidoreductase subunit N [Tundrisphaera lichenicola]|uniref:NADH-quinone oxidoreductase subunit N n=1 Tax=Tundrisphaera lichenicola TaxID=2029860 RepID=UPI003EBA726D
MTALENARQTLLILLPELLILLSAMTMMTLGAFVRLPRRTWAAASAATLVVSLLALIFLRNQVTDPYGSVALNDAMSGYCRLFFLLTGLLVLAMAHDQVDDGRAPEFFGSLLFINAGAMLVAASNELVFLFVGLELVSMPTYLLLYLSRRTSSTQEAATKYFFLSIFSSGLLLFGLAYLYGMAGVSNLKALSYLSQVSATLPGVPHSIFAIIAIVFVMAGLGFRVAAVPFHFYAPDVYQGSPTIVTALLAWIPKGVGFVAILRTLTAVIPTDMAPPYNLLTNQAAVLAWIIAVVTMTLGNTVALAQTNLKRLFAYSSIAHAGYLMIGVAVAFRNGDIVNHDVIQPAELGSEAVLFYLVSYALMTLGAFAVLIGLSTPERPVETLDDLAGLVRTHPVMALAMAICLFSLAGIPPLAGFLGKFNLFVSAFEASKASDAMMYQSLALIGVLNSAIGAYYYLKIVVAMYYRDPIGPPLKPSLTWPNATAIGACSVLTVVLGLWAAPIYSATRASAIDLTLHPQPIAIVAEETTETAEEELRRANEEAEASATRGLQWVPPAARRPVRP